MVPTQTMKTRTAVDQKSFFDEVADALAIDPIGKLAATSEDIKRK